MYSTIQYFGDATIPDQKLECLNFNFPGFYKYQKTV